MDTNQQQALIAAANAVREHAQARYSHFAVGAALLDEHGRIHVGTNIESSSYGLSICAERIALGAAISSGAVNFKAIAVIAATKNPVAPCGACRQLLHDYLPDATVILTNLDGQTRITTVAELLPDAFTEADLTTSNQ